jgi:DNA-binding PadR family transcriptional regulator
VPHILLGLLEQPAFGYELKDRFERTAIHFWAAELSQIYPTLQSLERQGLLSSRKEPSPKGPQRRVYRRTRAGGRELRRWLSGGPVLNRERVPYAAQFFFMAIVADAQIEEDFLLQLRADSSGRLGALRMIEREILKEHGRRLETMPEGVFQSYGVLRIGMAKLAARIEWCDEMLAALRARRLAHEEAQ